MLDFKGGFSVEEFRKQSKKTSPNKNNKVNKEKDTGEPKKKKSKKLKLKRKEKQIKLKKTKNKKTPKEKKRKEKRSDKIVKSVEKDKQPKSSRELNLVEAKEGGIDHIKIEVNSRKRKLSDNKDKYKKDKYDRSHNSNEPKIISSSKVVKVDNFSENFHHTSEQNRSHHHHLREMEYATINVNPSKKKKGLWSEVHHNLEAEANFIATAAAGLASPEFVTKRRYNESEHREVEHKEVEHRENTPDTDEYHSLWESDEEVAVPVPPRQSIKMNRAWESDEELFDRSQKTVNKRSTSPSYSNLEIPLNIKSFSRRTETPVASNNLCVDDKIKMLEKERRFVIFMYLVLR